MATQQLAKPPEPLNIEDPTHRGEQWKQFNIDWTYYEVAAKIDQEGGAVRVAHLLNVIGKEGQDIFDTFNLNDEDRVDVKGSPTVAKFRTLLVKSFEILKSEIKKIGNLYQ